MRSDSRLSRVLHVLIHMDRHDAPTTSDAIAEMLGTNPVVVRRTMSSLRQHGYVQALKGPGGGLRLARKLSEITLLDIYRALGEPTVFAMGPATDDAKCLVEQAVNAVLADALHDAEQLLLTRLGSVTLAELVEDFERRFAAIAPNQKCRR